MGGLGDGYAFQSSIQTNCTALNIQSIFTGGNGNGYNFKENIQVVCAAQALQSIFSGGNGNGYGYKENIQVVCAAQALQSIFSGGNGNGYGYKENIQVVCAAQALQSIFSGGNGNSYAFKENIQVACSAQTIESIFLGGNGNGAAMKEGGCNEVASIIRVTALENDGTYTEGDVLNLVVVFNSNVTVTGNPTLLLETGSSDGIGNYSSGSGTASITFQYTVLFGHVSSRLSYQDSNALLLNGGSIKDSENVDAIIALPEPGNPNSLSASKTLNIDANPPPIITQTQIALDNSSVSLSFSEAIYNTIGGSGIIEVSDFSLTLTQGNASLSSSTPSSVSINGNTITLGLPISGIPNGEELLSISPVVNSIYDTHGNAVEVSQNNNTIHLIPNIVATDLVLYLDAANNGSYAGSGNNWYDLSGYDNHGVLDGATYSSNGGGSISFDGTNDRVTIPDDNSLDFTSEITISYLLEKTGTLINSPYIVKGGSSRNFSTWIGQDGGIDIDNEPGGNEFRPLYIDTSTGGEEWIQITLTIENNTIKTYVNGTLKNSRSGSLGSVNNLSLIIGYLEAWNFYGKGKIKNLLLYNQALTDSQIFQNALATTKAPQILVTNIAADNSTASLTFDQITFNTDAGSGSLQASDFTLSLSGGNATLSSATPSSININGNIIELGLSLYGVVNGNEVLTISPITHAVFNTNGFAAFTIQNSNTVNLSFTNSAPTDIILSANAVDENLASGTVVGGLTTTDVDSGDTFTYTLVGGGSDNANFSISGANLVTAAELDFETKSSYSVVIQTSDGTDSYQEAFTISVNDLNEAPTDIGFAGTSSLEYLVVGGGGAGGKGNSNEGGGGGGAGGYLTGTITSIFGETFDVTVGAGGTGVNSTSSPGGNGGNSSLAGQNIATVTALGGGGGGACGSVAGSNGASGGGGSGCGTDRPGGSGTTGQGNNGGTGRWIGHSPGNGNGGGGGGSSSAGTNGAIRNAGTIDGGGAGTSNDISGSTTIYTAGGNGGPGRAYGNYNPPNQTGNSGNGGIGGTNYPGGNGASGIVVIRYGGNQIATGGTVIQNGGYTIHSFTQVENSSIVFQSGSASSSSSSVDEGVSIGTLVGSLLATDEDASTNTFTLVSGDGDTHNELFSISNSNLLVNGLIDYEQTQVLDIRVQVTDGQFTYDKVLTINVNDVNDTPTDITLSANAVDENLASGTVVGGLSTTDVDSGDTFTYTLVGGGSDNDRFSISGANLVTAAVLDFETKSSYSVVIQTSDGSATYSETFTITVDNVNEAPTDISFGEESFSNNGLILHLDSGNSSSYPGSGNTWYDLSENNYNAVLMNSPSFSSSSGGLIGLNGSSQWIQLNSFAGVLTNNSGYTISIWFKSTETNPSGGIHNNAIFSMHNTNGDNRYRIGAAPDANRGLYYNFSTGSSEGRVSQINLHDNQWHNVTITKNTGVEAQFYIDDILRVSNGSITNGVDFNSVGQVSIGQEYDGGNITDHFQGNIPIVMIYNRALDQIDRTSLYDHYKNRYIDGNLDSSTTRIDEEVSIGSVAASLYATDSDTSSFTFSLVNGNGTNDADNSLFTISGNQLVVNGNIDFEQNPSLEINIEVSDGSLTYVKAMTINVNDVNEAPTDISLSANAVDENITIGTTVGGLTTTDVDSGDTHTYTLVGGGSDNDRFSISGANLVTAAELDFEAKSSYSLVIQTSDGSATYSKTFTITVDNVNEAPTNISFNDEVVQNGLLMYLDATNENSRGTNQWSDLSGNGNHATINGATLVDSSYYLLDGNDWFSWSSDVLTTDSPYTMQGWIKTTNINWNGSNLFYNTWRSDKGIWWHFNTNGTLSWRHYGNGGNGGDLSGLDIIQGQWQMVTITYDGSNLKLYIDKTYKNSTNAGSYYAGPQNGNSGASMGKLHSRTSDNRYFYNGQIKNKLIYNRALSQSEIEHNYSNLNSNSTTTSDTNIDEATAIGTVAALLEGEDADSSSFTFALVNGNGTNDADNSLFTLSGNQLVVNGNIDFEQNPSLEINIEVSDGALTYVKAMIINVNDLNEAPTEINLEANATVTTSDLILHLDASNTTSYGGSGNTWYDLSGNGNHATLSGPTYNTEGYFEFDGNDVIQSINASSYSNLTIEIWMYDNISSGQRDILTYNGNAGSYTFSGLNNFRTDGNGLGAAQFYPSLISNQWVRFAYVKNEKVFINNTKSLKQNGNDNPYGSLSFGNARSDVRNKFRGKISRILVYQTSLTDDELDENYAAFENQYNGGSSSSSSNGGDTVEENASIGTLISELTVSDEDTNNTHVFSLVDGAGDIGRNNASVTVSGTQLLVNGTIDYESTPYLLVNIQVTDGSNSLTSSFTINVVDQNDTAPTAIGLSTTTFAEDIASGSVVATLSATDIDTASLNSFSYSLVSGDGINDASNSKFIISGNTLVISGTFDYETAASHAIYLQVNDGANTFNQAFTLSITDQNDAPTDILLSQTAINENTPIGSLVANLSVLDQDVLNNHVFTLYNSGDTQDDDNGSFTISGTSLLTNVDFDYETQTSHNIYVRVNDGLSNYFEAFTIYITDLNEVPTNISLSSGSSVTFSNVTSINDNEALNAIIGTLQTTDEDQNDTYTYALVNGNGTNDSDNTLFTLNGNQLILNTNLDYKLQTSVNINMQVSDGTNFFIKSFSFMIVDKTGPRLSALSIADDNGTITLQFDEAAFNTPSAIGSLTALDFAISITGGTASLTSNIPNSVTFDGTQYILGLTIQGATTGDETVLVSVAPNAVFDALGNAASGLQNNTITLHGDADSDGVLDSIDICPDTPVGETADVNGCAESQKDPDNDGVSGSSDNCPNTYNPSQTDNDNDGIGDPCDPDDDNDGVVDTVDNCQFVANPNQEDVDTDGIGDVCDLDNDNDGIEDTVEIALGLDPLDPDNDDDGINDADEIALGLDPLSSDSDNDGIDDAQDAFPLDVTEWIDTDNDDIGNNTDTDDDGDGYLDTSEIECQADPLDANSLPDDFDLDFNPDCLDEDDDNDGVLDTDDEFPYNQEEWIDNDGDGLGDNADFDDDNDTFSDDEDAFPLDATEWIDTDNDSIGNNTDTDDDGDGYPDTVEVECLADPLDANSLPDDFDLDFIPDCLDEDDDNDGFLDTEDDFPFDPKEWFDSDGDGLGNNIDPDDDNDTFLDEEDAFPFDAFEWLDTDRDGLGNNADTDDDNDGYLDLDEIECGSNPLSRRSRPSDFDGDYIPDCTDEDDDNDGVLDAIDAFPLNPYESVDTDGDSFGDNADWDSDNDGVPDSMDAFPNDPNESKDTDGDGIGDNTDLDKNNDGYPEGQIFVSSVLTPKSTGAESMWKVINIDEYNYSVIKIFSPDGSMVFKVVNYKNDWRGTHYDTGEALPTGPYLYQIYLGKDQDPISGWLYIFN